MENISKKLGLISLIGVILAFVLTYFVNSTFGLIIYIISFLLAAFDLIKAFKAEKLTPKEFLAVAVKERLFSVIAIISVGIFVYVYYLALLNEEINAMF